MITNKLRLKVIFLVMLLVFTNTVSTLEAKTWRPFDPTNPWPSQNTEHRVSGNVGITDPHKVAQFTVTGGYIKSSVVFSNNENYYYFYFYKYSDNTTYLYRVNKKGFLDWSVPIGDVRGGAPIVIDATDYDATKTDIILTQKTDGIMAFFDDGSLYKKTGDNSALNKMSDNFMAIDKNGEILFSSQVTSFYDPPSMTLSAKYYMNKISIDLLDGSVRSKVISEQFGQPEINDFESESSVVTDNDGYTYSVIGGKLVIYDEYL